MSSSNSARYSRRLADVRSTARGWSTRQTTTSDAGVTSLRPTLPKRRTASTSGSSPARMASRFSCSAPGSTCASSLWLHSTRPHGGGAMRWEHFVPRGDRQVLTPPAAYASVIGEAAVHVLCSLGQGDRTSIEDEVGVVAVREFGGGGGGGS